MLLHSLSLLRDKQRLILQAMAGVHSKLRLNLKVIDPSFLPLLLLHSSVLTCSLWFRDSCM